MRNRPHPIGRASEAPSSSRAVVFYWIVGLGVSATAGLTIMAMAYALSGRDPQSLAMLATSVAVGVGVAVAIASAFVKQPPSANIVPAPASSRRTAFVSLSSMWLALYVLAIANVQWLLGVANWPLEAALAAAAVATLSVVGLAYALFRYITRETDEYQRALLMRAALIAAALTFFALTAWGLIELYVGAPHFSVALALAPFFLCFAITNWWVRGRT